LTESQLVLSVDALADLAEIQDHIIWQDREMRATAALSRLRRALSSVAFMPGIGRKRADIGPAVPPCYAVARCLYNPAVQRWYFRPANRRRKTQPEARLRRLPLIEQFAAE
jgi:plasmid stabilization system protein ParE